MGDDDPGFPRPRCRFLPQERRAALLLSTTSKESRGLAAAGISAAYRREAEHEDLQVHFLKFAVTVPPLADDDGYIQSNIFDPTVDANHRGAGRDIDNEAAQLSTKKAPLTK